MDNGHYPEDLLVGFFPLVFAVNAIRPEDTDVTGKRSTFDNFLDAIAATLIEDQTTATTEHDKRRSISIFKSDDEESSDEEDGLQDHFGGSFRKRNSSTFGFGRVRPTASISNDLTEGAGGTSYAKALTQGQGFFQRARIVSVSQKYGFPPSKDPHGTQNLAYELHEIMKKRAPATEREQAMTRLFQQQYPVTGIIRSQWLEKHVHALPSAIMVVCRVTDSRKYQAEQDQHLLETVEHLLYSLVPKRQCSIQIVGLMSDGITDTQGEEWSQVVLRALVSEDSTNTPFTVTLLRASTDLKCNDSDLPSSEALRRLHRTVRDASLMYYLRQARRTKDKLVHLTDDKRKRGPLPVQFSPLMVRYSFKIAIFYEFQMKHEKSLRFYAEAYRHTSNYYRWLLSRKGKSSDIITEQDQDAGTTSSPQMDGISDGVEVELNGGSNSDSTIWSRVVPKPSDDILYQCRAVADWLNLKLLSSGFSSHTEGGLMAAANQWRLHCQVFATRRHSSKLNIEDWLEWSYIARQRVVMSQLVERHPPTALGDLGNGFDEVVLRCTPWRTYEAAAEAMLRLGREMCKARAQGLYQPLKDKSERKDPSHARYVGGLSPDGLALLFHEEICINHRQKALDLILRAISLFEHVQEKEKRGFFAEDEFHERSSSRTGARLYYVAGGILLGKGRHKEAEDHLSKASRYSRGWPELELAVRRMLIECYEQHIPSQSEVSESSETLVSMILDSYFNAEMSSQDLRRALGHFAAMSGGNRLRWYREIQDEEDPTVPFSFAVTFPGKTHATSGDTVEASVVIKSNLDYAIHVNSASLGTLAGQLPIPTNDLLSAANAMEGSDGGIIIQAKTAITVSTKLELPTDLTAIACDDSGNGGELQGIAGKGSFAKNAKPRSAGLTSAGGARLVSEEILQPGNRNSQGWNVRFLGGKPLLCDDLHIVFYPVQAEKASGGMEQVTLIELSIIKKKKKTAANIKRTPFEEENYIASAWSRPSIVPFSKGPRSLRVLEPQPQLVITNLTEPLTQGKALEGTVNRVLLKLQAGPDERCSNVKLSLSCYSVLITPFGSTKRLVSEQELAGVENSLDMKISSLRTPILVSVSPTPTDVSVASGFGYNLPVGWNVAGSGYKEVGKVLEPLNEGEVSYVSVELFRPAAHTQRQPQTEGDLNEEDVGDLSSCKTDFYVTLTYTQERPSSRQQNKSKRRSIRQRPVMSASKNVVSGKSDIVATEPITPEPTTETLKEVSLEYTASIVWTSPIVSTFSWGAKKIVPSGNRHPSNRANGDADETDECVIVDGESTSIRCNLHLDGSMDWLKTELVAIRFEVGTFCSFSNATL